MRSLRHLALVLSLPAALGAQTPQTVQSQPSVQTGQPAQTVQPDQPIHSDQPIQPDQPMQPRTTLPSDSNCRARPTWCQGARDRVAAAKDRPVDILFVGDSITEGWTSVEWGGQKRGAAVWDKTYVPLHALNFGVGADTTQNVLYRLDTMDVHDLHPKVTVLLIGTNNSHDTAADIASGVQADLTRLRQLYPATRIILVSILPNARASALMTETNTLIRPMADDKTVYFLDLAAKMTPVGDSWLGLGPDKLHPTQVGYQLWADTMEPLLTRLLAMAPPNPAAQKALPPATP